MKYYSFDRYIDELKDKAKETIDMYIKDTRYTYSKLCEKYNINLIFINNVSQGFQLYIIDMVEAGMIKLSNSLWEDIFNWKNDIYRPEMYKMRDGKKEYVIGDFQTSGKFDLSFRIKGENDYSIICYNRENQASFIFSPGTATLEHLLETCFSSYIKNEVAKDIVDKYIDKQINNISFSV